MKKFLLISDLHASDEDPSSFSAPSYVSSFLPTTSSSLDPISELEKLIKSGEIQPDFILCPGDITNRSNTSAFTFAWNKLNALASMCSAKLIATVGNHDVDSRYKSNNFDPKGYVMSLTPKIPVEDRVKYLEFWAENFTIISENDCNIIILNTSAYHGNGVDSAREIEHGRISEMTLQLLANTIETLPLAGTNIVLCHHHPLRGDKGDIEYEGLTRGGEKLVELLDQSSNSWVIIHGHKHVPDMFYGQGNTNAPLIISCASFSAQVNADSQNKNPNQFHYLVTDPSAANEHELNLAGTLYSWTWQPGIGWREAHRNFHGLPYVAGYGYKGSIKALAKKIDDYLTTENSTWKHWTDMLSAFKILARLTPVDFSKLENELKNLNISILLDGDGTTISQVGRNP